MSSTLPESLDAWSSSGAAPAFSQEQILAAVQRIREPAYIVRDERGRLGVAFGGHTLRPQDINGAPVWPLLAMLPPVFPEWLGDRSFNEVHGTRFPYVTGAMANGIATTRLVVAMAKANMLGFFGAAGLGYERVVAGVDELIATLGHTPLSWGVNLIHSPNEPDLEFAVSELLIQRGVRRVEASAYMGLTPAIVRYAASGLSQDPSGKIRRKNHVFAKISRPEVARHFLAPAPKAMLDALVQRGQLSAEEAKLALLVPIAEDITVESDSGGHTDNRPLGSLFPVIAALRDELVAKHGYARPIRVGAAGGLGTPASVASAFALGAAYVLTGSVNQAAVESGLSEEGRRQLAVAGIADVVMAPAADMFELGVKVQVLKRGTMFAVRAQRLYEAYIGHDSIEAMPAALREKLEREVLGRSLETVWSETRAYWQARDPREIERAARDPKHRMALCFRWYLGQASRWAIVGESARKLDYQIWCGPAMGAFNDWAAGSFLADPARREVVSIALNLMEGAATLTRAQQLRSAGLPVPPAAFQFRPRPLC